jgi:Zn finger protein HypA/HybF involved in hydrogenase expression
MSNRSKWACPHCGSQNVQISLPTWYTESADFTLTLVDTNTEAEVLWYWCPDCEQTDDGEPTRTDPLEDA